MIRMIVVGSLLLVLALAAFGSPALAQGPAPTPPAPGANPWGYGWGPGGMMGGWWGGYGPTPGYTSTVPYGYPGRGMGPGMMGGWRGYGYGYAPNAAPLSLDQAMANAKQYVATLNNSDLVLAEMEEYTQNFYGVVKEQSTGTNAFQFLIDKYTGAISPEMGPNMMWNTKYSPMAGMTLAPHAPLGPAGYGGTGAGVGGAWFNSPSAAMPVTLIQAHDNAAQYLKTSLPNTTVEDQGDTFYGYYNFDVLQNGKTYGMLSVNGYTGAVWYHTWHGNFIATKELDQ